MPKSLPEFEDELYAGLTPYIHGDMFSKGPQHRDIYVMYHLHPKSQPPAQTKIEINGNLETAVYIIRYS